MSSIPARKYAMFARAGGILSRAKRSHCINQFYHMRPSIVFFSVSAVALLFAHDPASAQCASGWGVFQLPDGKNSPCSQFDVDSSSKPTGSLLTPSELLGGGGTASTNNLFSGTELTVTGNIHDLGTLSTDSSIIERIPKAKPGRPMVRDLFLRSSEHWKSVWIAQKGR